MTVNRDVDGYAETLNVPKNAKKQPTENQKHT